MGYFVKAHKLSSFHRRIHKLEAMLADLQRQQIPCTCRQLTFAEENRAEEIEAEINALVQSIVANQDRREVKIQS